MPRVLKYTIKKSDIPLSLGAFLRMKGFSDSMIVSMKHHGGVLVNNKFRRMIDPLQIDDIVKITFADESPSLVANPQLDLSILYEDEDLIAIDKPIDMLVHPAGIGFDDAVGNFFTAHCPRLTFRPLGRLDRNTTGICLIAKNRLAASKLTPRVDKIYYAIAEGMIMEDQGMIDAPLLRVAGSVISQKVDERGKPSRTRFWVIERTSTHSFLCIKLETGRTHQIRVHMKHYGHPLAGDALYGGSTDIITRHALHCAQISFFHPISGKSIKITSHLPEDMQKLLKYNL